MTLGTDLNDDVLTEILVRLPPKSILRCRAVCKRWRHATTCATFLATYSLRRPLDLILDSQHNSFNEYPLDRVALDGGDGCRRLLDHRPSLKFLASCDGLLLFWISMSPHGVTFVICNPATRQCARFPAMATKPGMWVVPSGFYFHRPSGKHRVLCFGKNEGDEDIFQGIIRYSQVHYVLSTGAGQPRRLRPFTDFIGNTPSPPFGVDVGGTLHWAQHPWIGGNSSAMLAFDTVSEKFRRMPLPPVAADHFINLFEMRGKLAASVMGEWPFLDVWALDNYAGERWSHNVRVELPAEAAATVPNYRVKYGEAVAALEGDVLVLFTVGGWVTLYDVKKKKTVRVVRRGDNRASRHWGV
ncbi:unnamed protein product [Alopecurus aequalis]